MTGLEARLGFTIGSLAVNVDLSVGSDARLALLGPNGAGKTSVLRAIAGLIRPDQGHVELDGTVLSGPGRFVPPEQRPIALVSQPRSLFPHLSALDNVAFPLREAGARRGEARIEAGGWLDRVGLPGPLHDRRPSELSEGEAQRVTLARALARPARLLLLDEPLVGVDATSRRDLIGLIEERARVHSWPMLVVTHDVSEARDLSDEVAILEAGIVIDRGPLAEVIARARSDYIAGLSG